MKILVTAVLAVTLGAEICLAQSESSVERAIRSADVAWSKAAEAKDLERVLAVFADGASELAPNTPISTGKEAIRKAWASYFATPGFAISWQPTKVEAAAGGDLGYSMGTYTLTVHDASARPVTDRGKYVTVWKKQADGSWKVVADIFNSDLPVPAAK